MPQFSRPIFWKAATAATVVLVAAMSAQAATSINYGDFSDVPPGTVAYNDVTESSFSDDVPLYGAPTITSNLLDFEPIAFGTSSSGGASSLTDGQLNFTIDAIDGTGVTSFTIDEGGDYSFSGLTPTPGTFVSASAGATISILEVDGVALPNAINYFVSGTFVTDYPTAGGAPVTGLLPWSLTTNVDLTSVLPQGYQQGATLIEVAINNQLTTATTPGNQAAIAKKDFQINVTTIPEPCSLALLGLGGLLIARRRRG